MLVCVCACRNNLFYVITYQVLNCALEKYHQLTHRSVNPVPMSCHYHVKRAKLVLLLMDAYLTMKGTDKHECYPPFKGVTSQNLSTLVY